MNDTRTRCPALNHTPQRAQLSACDDELAGMEDMLGRFQVRSLCTLNVYAYTARTEDPTGQLFRVTMVV